MEDGEDALSSLQTGATARPCSNCNNQWYWAHRLTGWQAAVRLPQLFAAVFGDAQVGAGKRVRPVLAGQVSRGRAGEKARPDRCPTLAPACRSHGRSRSRRASGTSRRGRAGGRFRRLASTLLRAPPTLAAAPAARTRRRSRTCSRPCPSCVEEVRVEETTRLSRPLPRRTSPPWRRPRGGAAARRACSRRRPWRPGTASSSSATRAARTSRRRASTTP